MKFNEQRYGKVDRLVRDAIEQAEKTLAKFDADTLDFNDETIARTASINIAMHRRASMRMAELQAKGSVGAGAGAEEARQEMQQLAMDTQFAADDTLSQLEMQRNQMLQRSFEVSAQLGGSISQTQIAGANTLGQLSAAQGGQLQQALSNQLGFETLANANTQLGENLQAAAQTNAMQFELLGMQFARDTYQAPHYPSFLEGLLAIKALPPGAMQGPATGLMAGLRSSAAQGMFA